MLLLVGHGTKNKKGGENGKLIMDFYDLSEYNYFMNIGGGWDMGVKKN
jgi:hypothetical protein